MAVASLVLVGSSSATTGGLVITSSTTLSEDHQGNVLIDADGVTLDSAGHLISGRGVALDAGIFLGGRANVTVKNC
jgi:hypothetical protein